MVPKNATDDTISEATVLEEKLSTAELSVPDASISTAKDDSFASKKDEISEEISREKKSAATPSESYSSSKEKRTSTPNEQSVGNTEKTNEDLSSVSHDLKKLKHMASKKYVIKISCLYLYLVYLVYFFQSCLIFAHFLTARACI